MVKEWYRDRSDRLEHREFNSVLGTTAERFRPGRPSHLLGKRRWGRDGTGGGTSEWCLATPATQPTGTRTQST